MKPFRTLALFTLTLTPFLAFADDSFIPLTSIPGLVGLTAAPSLPAFLNSLYRISIGAVAVLAVLQIIYAGFELMRSADSISKNQSAKKRIQNAIFGLILVLSPAIVFGLINPKILDLNFDISPLKTNLNKLNIETGSSGQPEGLTMDWTDGTSSREVAQKKCTDEGGTAVFVCSGGTGARNVEIGEACRTGETSSVSCYKEQTAGSCNTALYAATTIIPQGASTADLRSDGYVQVDKSCCDGISGTNLCWAKPK